MIFFAGSVCCPSKQSISRACRVDAHNRTIASVRFTRHRTKRVSARETRDRMRSTLILDNFRKCSQVALIARMSMQPSAVVFPTRFRMTRGLSKRSLIESSAKSRFHRGASNARTLNRYSRFVYRRGGWSDTARAQRVAASPPPFLPRARRYLPTYLLYREAYWRVQMVHPLLPAV